MSANQHDVVIVGGGAGGIAVASSLLKRDRSLDIAVIEPSEFHHYQPGLTMVGGGVFASEEIVKPMKHVMPRRVSWIKESVTEFRPDEHAVLLSDKTTISYRILVAAPGLTLNWSGVDGLAETLGQNGVTSNYDPKCAPYTWDLVKSLGSGNAVFTQAPMPIKCAGAPQKALYLSCFEWEEKGRLKNINVSFHNAGGVLFGVPEYVPALELYMNRYGVDQQFNHTLVAVDGSAKKAWFSVPGQDITKEVSFDMLHVCPPQTAPAFVSSSPLANETGWIDVDQDTLQHVRHDKVFGLGDACSTPNAKTAAAVRKQAPVVAENVIAALAGKAPTAVYDGYGSCPLTVERGKVVLAEFGYGGKLLPSAPSWMLDGSKASRLAWHLKATLLPPIYFELMLKGREWLAKPAHASSPTPQSPSIPSIFSQ